METAEPVLRPATDAELPQLLALLPQLTSDLHKAATVPPLDRARAILDEQRRHGDIVVVVAEDAANATLVGSCTIVIVPNLTYGGRPWAMIENVVVASGWRGRGIGTRLLDYVCDLARQHDCYKVQLISGAKDEQVAFYRRNGLDDARSRGFKKYL